MSRKIYVNQSDKIKLLRDITIVENPDSCMIFCNTKQKVDEVYNELTNLKYTCEKNSWWNGTK